MPELSESHLFEPDALIKAQYLESNHRTTPLEPEAALLFAVLAEAIQTFQKYASSTSKKGQTLFRDAEAWIWNEESDYIVSFKSVCRLNGLDPAYVRRGLLQWRATNAGRVATPPRKPAAKKLQARTVATTNRVAQALRRRFRRPRLKGGW
jgi:hypothetical protein